jgi:hypothetical protein
MKAKFTYGIIFFISAMNVHAQQAIKLNLRDLAQVAEVDERYQSFNIEMCEVVGGKVCWIQQR